MNSGNLGEVISIVANDIEESRLLKTDLLGDAIESALSETGGTKDIGLFRTPDHVRHFMTALIEPTFEDVAFVVDDLEKELQGKEILIKPNSPSDGVTVVFIIESGAPVEFLEYKLE